MKATRDPKATAEAAIKLEAPVKTADPHLCKLPYSPAPSPYP